MDPHSTSPGQPPSTSERLIRALEAHATAEAQDAVDCDELLNRTNDPSLTLLLHLIVDDLHRHRTLLDSMVRRLQEPVECMPSPTELALETANPVPDVQLATTLRALIRNAHESARHLRHVARQEHGVYDGLYAILLEIIARDSEKHATILRHLLVRAEDRHV